MQRILLFITCLFLGPTGLHRFLTGKWKSGLLYFFTGGIFLGGWIYDLILIGSGRFDCNDLIWLDAMDDSFKNKLSTETRKVEDKLTDGVKKIENKLLDGTKIIENKVLRETRKIEDKLISNERLLENHNEKVERNMINSYKNGDIGYYTTNDFVYKDNDIEIVNQHDMKSDYTDLNFITTGKSVEIDKIIKISALRYRNNRKVNEFVTFVNPDIILQENVINHSKITNDDVRYGPKIDQVIGNLLEFIGSDIIISGNGKETIKFLRANSRKSNLSCGDIYYADKLRINKIIMEK